LFLEATTESSLSAALVIVDYQNDFCPGGALGVEGGHEIAAPINELARSFDTVVATRDWHPPDHASFESEGGPWPVHCVQGTEGAELHPELDRERIDHIVEVGATREDEGYSGFEGSDLEDFLREHGVERLVVTGIATDYCVRATTLDGRKLGFDVTVVEDAIRAVDVEPGDGERALEEMREAGAGVATSDEVLAAARS
jgi:nicotinamidase/pyrazinamidase